MHCFRCSHILFELESFGAKHCAYECLNCKFWYELDKHKQFYMVGFFCFDKNYYFELINNVWSIGVREKHICHCNEYLTETSFQEIEIIYQKMVNICTILDYLRRSNDDADDENKYIDFESNIEKYIKLLPFI